MDFCLPTSSIFEDVLDLPSPPKMPQVKVEFFEIPEAKNKHPGGDWYPG